MHVTICGQRGSAWSASIVGHPMMDDCATTHNTVGSRSIVRFPFFSAISS